MSAQNTQFSSRIAFILVTAGSAIGLGNIWSFPFVAGKNGGGAFLMIYLAALLLIATPIFMAELLLGRAGKASPPEALSRLRAYARGRLPWQWLGGIGVIALLGVVSFYSVIAGQALSFAVEGALGHFSGLDGAGTKGLDQTFKSNFWTPFLWSALFLAATAAIVSRDINRGIEKAGQYLMPLLFLLLLMLVVYAAIKGDFAAAWAFLFDMRATDIGPRVVLEAVGQAFFTLGIGAGGIMMYGAYMGQDVNLARATMWIVGLDLLVALLAGLAIFPLVFADPAVQPAAGPALIFITLPTVFGNLPFGALMAFMFFLLLSFAAITSSISMLEPAVAWLSEKGITRRIGAVIAGGAALLLSILTVLSFTHWQNFYPLAGVGLNGMTPFDLLREGISNIVLPLVGLGFALLAGWGLSSKQTVHLLGLGDGLIFQTWLWLLRFLVPVVILFMFLYLTVGL